MIKHISPQKVHCHMLKAKFLCKRFPELESKQCPDEPGEIQRLLHIPSSLCDLSKYKQIIKVLKMTCTGCSSYIGFPLNTHSEDGTEEKIYFQFSISLAYHLF